MLSRLLFVALCLSSSVGLYGDEIHTGPKSATVLIIRHAEKPAEVSDGLGPEGINRSEDYEDYFPSRLVLGKAIKPEVIFAAQKTESNNRPFLTVKLLADKLGLTIDDRFTDQRVEDLADDLRSGKYDGKTILICWHHGKIPKLLRQFAVDPDSLLGSQDWPDTVFGWLVMLEFNAEGSVKTSIVVNEKLEPDDKIDPPKREP